MKTVSLHIILVLIFASLQGHSQTYSLSGKIINNSTGEGVPSATVALQNTHSFRVSNEGGLYRFGRLKPGEYTLLVSCVGFRDTAVTVTINTTNAELNIQLAIAAVTLDSATVKRAKERTGMTRLKDIEGTAIYAGKKNEVIVLDNNTANTAANNSRQIYSKITGLNIWENDGAGIQLGIGGRGLNPNRTTNFNTRQNGYDMSADALGYPESYYSPPAEGIDRIEIVRGAASLQYGTQFGGLVNFRLNKGPEDLPWQIVSRQTAGSWGFFNSFNSIGGTVNKVNYYGFFDHKSGNGWRPNSNFNVNAAYASAIYNVNDKLSVTAQFTYMKYLAHQPGGLTDQMFAEDPRQSIRTRNWFTVNWNLAAVLLDYSISDHLKFNSRFFGLVASRSALGILTYINRTDPKGPRDLWTDHYKNWGNESRLLYSYKIKSRFANLLIGFRYYHGHTDRQQGLGNDGSNGTKDDFNFDHPDSLNYSKYSFPNQNISVFAENIFPVTSKLSIIPGVRFEYIVTEANGFYSIVNRDLAGNIIYSEKVDEARDNTRSFVIGGIGVSYYVSNAIQLYANISENYRAINFNDMRVINPNLQVDPDLHDEKGCSADLGIRGAITGVLNYDVSLFFINYNNKIGTILRVDTSNFNLYNFRTNVSQSRHIGVESFAELDIWRLIKGSTAKTKLTIFSNLSFIDARYINSKESAYENKKVELAPDIILKSGIGFKKGKFSGSYQFAYTAEQYTEASNALFTANAINGLIPSYTVMDISAGYNINKIFTVQVTVNNLTNNMYFTRRADSYPGPGIIPSDGRSYFITLQARIQ